MKILVLADLHLNKEMITSAFYLNKLKRSKMNWYEGHKKDIDLVVIAGDIVEHSIMNSNIDPFDALYKFFEKDVVFCLGNHEFAYSSHPEVLEYWKKWSHPHVHCLDIDGSYRKDNVNFVGNVLWYDFTLNNCRTLMKGEIVDGWLDATIKNFDPLIENEKCQKQILSNLITNDDVKNVLVTHMVPHKNLNAFSIDDPFSPYNAYSGMDDFLLTIQNKRANLSHAICGHTHRRIMDTIHGVDCINVGNDYHFRSPSISYFILEIN